MINDQSVDSFFDELKAIDREACLSDMRKEAGAIKFLQKGLGQIGKLWKSGGKGLQTAYRGGVRQAGKGAGTAGKMWGGAKNVASKYRQAGTVAGIGGLAAYGGAKAIAGNPQPRY